MGRDVDGEGVSGAAQVGSVHVGCAWDTAVARANRAIRLPRSRADPDGAARHNFRLVERLDGVLIASLLRRSRARPEQKCVLILIDIVTGASFSLFWEFGRSASDGEQRKIIDFWNFLFRLLKVTNNFH